MTKRFNIIILLYAMFLALCPTTGAEAQVFTHRLPIYIVNGERMTEEEVRAIDPEDIVSNELLPADEATIEKYGQDAANGVIVIGHLLFQFLSRIMKMPFYGTFTDTEPFCDCLLRQSVNVKRNQNLPLQIV